MRLITRLFVRPICRTERCIPCATSRLVIYAKSSVSYLIRREVLLAVLRAKEAGKLFTLFATGIRSYFELKEKRKGTESQTAGTGIHVLRNRCPQFRCRSNSLGEIVVYDTREYLPHWLISREMLPLLRWRMSSNNYFIAAG